MKIPNLMPFQDIEFNGDKFIDEEFLKLKEKYFIKTIVETGTCLGSTTLWFAKNFEWVYTTEINASFLKIAYERFTKAKDEFLRNGILCYLGDSINSIAKFIKEIDNNSIWFLDDHWEKSVPLLKELELIAQAELKPVIVIHDMKVPGHPELGFDIYNGQAFTYEWVKPGLDSIYGSGGYNYYFNSEATGAKRGCLFITPK